MSFSVITGCKPLCHYNCAIVKFGGVWQMFIISFFFIITDFVVSVDRYNGKDSEKFCPEKTVWYKREFVVICIHVRQ